MVFNYIFITAHFCCSLAFFHFQSMSEKMKFYILLIFLGVLENCTVFPHSWTIIEYWQHSYHKASVPPTSPTPPCQVWFLSFIHKAPSLPLLLQGVLKRSVVTFLVFYNSRHDQHQDEIPQVRLVQMHADFLVGN